MCSLENGWLFLQETGTAGMEKTRLLARECVSFTGMNADIENLIKECPVCLEFQQTKPKPLIPHVILEGPWETLNAGILQLKNKLFLCLIGHKTI